MVSILSAVPVRADLVLFCRDARGHAGRLPDLCTVERDLRTGRGAAGCRADERRAPTGVPLFGQWNDYYTYGPLYYACVAWIALLVAAAVAALIKNCVNRRLLRNLWLPALVLLFAATYWINFNPTEAGSNVYLQRFFELPTFIGYCSFMLWESLRISRIIPSNSGYEDFFAASSLRAGLADRAWNVKRVSAHGPRPAPEALQAAAKNEAYPLPDGDTVLKTRPVRGGWFYWTEDVGTLRRLNEELKDTAGYLAEENALLQQEAELEEGRRRTAHQTELYNAITKRVEPQLAALDRLLDDLEENPEPDGGDI